MMKNNISFDINKIIEKLKKNRTVYCSEADFKHQLAWVIKEEYLNAVEIFIEYPLKINGRRRRIDIVVFLNNKLIPIELKYKTKEAKIEIGKRQITLTNNPKDFGKFDYLLDIEKIEGLRKEKDFIEGYTIFITNESGYQETENANNQDVAFSLKNGEIKTGQLKWKNYDDPKRFGRRKETIVLNGEYEIKWKVFETYTNLIKNEKENFFILINKIT